MSKKKLCIITILGILTTILFVLKSLISSEISLADEAYYIQTAFRFYQGDAMLVDDWGAPQLMGFLLLPFVYLYMSIVKSTEGIILYFRILYLIYKCFVLAFCYNKLRKYDLFGIIGLSIYYFFTPFNIDSLNYNTIPIGMILMIGAVILSDKRKPFDYYLCGIFLAVSVLAQPFCILIYLAGAIATLWKIRIGNDNNKWKPLKDYTYISAGAFTILIIFLIYIFQKTSLKDIVQNLPYILGGEGRNVSSFIGIAKLIYKPIKSWYYGVFYDYPLVAIVNTVFLFFLLYLKYYKKTYTNYLIYGAMFVLTLSCLLIIMLGGAFLENIFFVPFIWFFIEELFLIEKNKEVFYSIFIISILYMISVSFATITGIVTISAAICPIVVFSITLLPDFLQVKTQNTKKKGISFLLICSMVLSICVLIMRIFYVWTGSLLTNDYSYYLEKGPLKGTYVDEDIYIIYSDMLYDLDSIPNTSEEILFCGMNYALPYLYNNMTCGTLCSSFLELDYGLLEQYYALHPDKFPTVVYYYYFEDTPNYENDINSWFLQYIYSNYEIYEIDGRLLAMSKR